MNGNACDRCGKVRGTAYETAKTSPNAYDAAAEAWRVGGIAVGLGDVARAVCLCAKCRRTILGFLRWIVTPRLSPEATSS